MWKIALISLTLIVITACSESKEKETMGSDVDFVDVEIKYAENFRLKKTDSGYLLELLDPKTKALNQSIKINPSESQKIISLTATLNGMFAILEAQDRVVGISSAEHIYDPTLRRMCKSGEIEEFGDETRNSVEKIVASKADIILHDIVHKAYPNTKKIEKFGIKILPIYDWRENHPLAKAEWIKVVGALTGKMKEANEFFDEVESNYKHLQEVAGKYSKRPSVISGHLWQDIWYTPSGENYFAIMIDDAGGHYKYKDTKGTESLQFSIEQIIKENKETKYWINPGVQSKSLIRQRNPHAKHLDAFDNNIYCYSVRMHKYWEQGASRPDLVLSDLIHIFHPEEKSISKFNFYQNIR